MSNKAIPNINAINAEAAVYSLKLARAYIRSTGSIPALNHIRVALRSAEGVLRHAQRRATATEKCRT